MLVIGRDAKRVLGAADLLHLIRAPKDHIDRRILHTMISRVPLVVGLGTRM